MPHSPFEIPSAVENSIISQPAVSMSSRTVSVISSLSTCGQGWQSKIHPKKNNKKHQKNQIKMGFGGFLKYLILIFNLWK
jgi:hypothetical protein